MDKTSNQRRDYSDPRPIWNTPVRFFERQRAVGLVRVHGVGRSDVAGMADPEVVAVGVNQARQCSASSSELSLSMLKHSTLTLTAR